MDLCSRRVVGWSSRRAHDRAARARRLAARDRARQPPPGLIHHTDRGGQYAGHDYRAVLRRAGMRQSMSRAANCYDNAFMESCFGTIKTELEMTEYENMPQARTEIASYLAYYNTERRHSSLDYLSPTAFEVPLSPIPIKPLRLSEICQASHRPLGGTLLVLLVPMHDNGLNFSEIRKGRVIMPKLTVESVGEFEVPQGKRLVLR